MLGAWTGDGASSLCGVQGKLFFVQVFAKLACTEERGLGQMSVPPSTKGTSTSPYHVFFLAAEPKTVQQLPR